MRWTQLALWIFILGAGLCAAQAPQGEPALPAAAEQGGEAQAAEEGEPGGVAAVSRGDVIKLKMGTELRGVQVIRMTPVVLEVQPYAGALLRIPRKQVESVIYDDIEPARDKQGQAAGAGGAVQDQIPAQRISPKLNSKLLAVLPGLPLSFEGEDVIAVLEDIAGRAGVTLVVDDSVRAFPPSTRQWTLQVPEGTTLRALLRDTLLEDFDNLEVLYEYGQIRVTAKQAPTPGGEAAPNPQGM